MSGGNEPRSRFHSFCTRLMNLPALRGVSVREAEKRKKQKLLLLHAAHKLASTLRRFSSWGYTYTQTKTHTHTQTYRHRHRHTDTDTDTHTHTYIHIPQQNLKSQCPTFTTKKSPHRLFLQNYRSGDLPKLSQLQQSAPFPPPQAPQVPAEALLLLLLLLRTQPLCSLPQQPQPH